MNYSYWKSGGIPEAVERELDEWVDDNVILAIEELLKDSEIWIELNDKKQLIAKFISMEKPGNCDLWKKEFVLLDAVKEYIGDHLPADLNNYGGDDREEIQAEFNLMADQFKEMAVMIRAAVSSWR